MRSLLLAFLGVVCAMGQAPDNTLRYAPAASSRPPALAQVPPGSVPVDFAQVKILFQPPPPPYPALAKIARIQGTVLVEVFADATGFPEGAAAVEGPAQLRKVAEDYARQWRFAPFLQNGVPIRVRFKLIMPFKLKNGGRFPITQAVVRIDADAPGVTLDAKALEGAVTAGLARLGVKVVPPGQVDPTTTHHLGIAIQVNRTGEGLTWYTVAMRCSLVADLMLVANAPGQPPQVWFANRGGGHRGDGTQSGLSTVLTHTLEDLVYPAQEPRLRSLAAPGSAPAPTAREVREGYSEPFILKQRLSAPPASAKAAHGPVILAVSYDAQGVPLAVEVQRGRPELVATAIQDAMAMMFEPGKANGVAQAETVLVTLEY